MKPIKKKDRIKNKVKRRKYRIKYEKEHNQKIRKREKKYRIKNRDKINKKSKKWRKDNELHIKKYNQMRKKERNKYLQEKRKKDKNFKLLDILRIRICKALKGLIKKDSTIKLLDCTIKELRQHLEKKFKEGMNWKNYGYYGWHVDHIKSCCTFDLSKVSEQRKCFHYTNLRPLWAKENMRRPRK